VSARVRLDAVSVDAIAERVADLLADQIVDRAAGLIADRIEGAGSPDLIDAAEVARRFGVARSWVYEHAEDLGAIRLGDGDRPRLRFDAAIVAERLTPCSTSRASEQGEDRTPPRIAPRRRGAAKGTERDLLPIRPPGGRK
jgi:hypothetical protein